MLMEPGCGGFPSLHLSLLQAIHLVLSSEGLELNDSNTKEEQISVCFFFQNMVCLHSNC